MTTNPDPQPAPAKAVAQPSQERQPAVPPAAAPGQSPPLLAGYEDFAGEITVANGPMPLWFRRMPYWTLLAALAYFLYVRAFDPVNLAFAGLFIAWMIYTPIAQKRGWFFIPM